MVHQKPLNPPGENCCIWLWGNQRVSTSPAIFLRSFTDAIMAINGPSNLFDIANNTIRKYREACLQKEIECSPPILSSCLLMPFVLQNCAVIDTNISLAEDIAKLGILILLEDELKVKANIICQANIQSSNYNIMKLQYSTCTLQGRVVPSELLYLPPTLGFQIAEKQQPPTLRLRSMNDGKGGTKLQYIITNEQCDPCYCGDKLNGMK